MVASQLFSVEYLRMGFLAHRTRTSLPYQVLMVCSSERCAPWSPLTRWCSCPPCLLNIHIICHRNFCQSDKSPQCYLNLFLPPPLLLSPLSLLPFLPLSVPFSPSPNRLSSSLPPMLSYCSVQDLQASCLFLTSKQVFSWTGGTPWLSNCLLSKFKRTLVQILGKVGSSELSGQGILPIGEL